MRWLLLLFSVALCAQPPTLHDIAVDRHANLSKKIATCKDIPGPYGAWLAVVAQSSSDIKAVLNAGSASTWPADKERIKTILGAMKISHGPTAEEDTRRAFVESKLPVEEIRALVQVNRALREFERFIVNGII